MRAFATCSVLGPLIMDSSLNIFGRFMMRIVIFVTCLFFPLEAGLHRRHYILGDEATSLVVRLTSTTQFVSFWSHPSLQISDIYCFSATCKTAENTGESSRRTIQSNNLDLLCYNYKLIVVDVLKPCAVSYASLNQEAMTSHHLWYLSISASLLSPTSCIFYCLNPS